MRHGCRSPPRIANAWPQNSDPSFWEGGQAAETVQRDESIGQRRRALAAALNTAVEELEQERTLRVRRAALRPERVALFIAIARRAWAGHRTLAPALAALGSAPRAGTGCW